MLKEGSVAVELVAGVCLADDPVVAEGVSQSKPVIAYCRIGERSSHTWFVLKYLLGVDTVLNYDGSWTEWGNLVGAPVEKGAAKSAGQA